MPGWRATWKSGVSAAEAGAAAGTTQTARPIARRRNDRMVPPPTRPDGRTGRRAMSLLDRRTITNPPMRHNRGRAVAPSVAATASRLVGVSAVEIAGDVDVVIVEPAAVL